MSHNMQEIDDATQAVKDIIKKKGLSRFTPKIGIILGTGLGGLADKVTNKVSINYRQIPGFPMATVATHAGYLILGKLSGRSVVMMAGRFHYYEGYSMEEITLPVRVMQKLGVSTLIVSNVSGGLNPSYKLGDICLMDDHINMVADNPLRGPQDSRLGSPFPDMSAPYTQSHQELIKDIARDLKIPINTGAVYVMLSGPNLETRAEYRFLRWIGSDIVGMSTVPEVLVAVQAGMKVVGFSIVSDMCLPDALEPVDIKEIIKAGKDAEPKLTKIVTQFIKKCKP